MADRLDFDPEDIERGGNSSDEEADEKDASAGREHYQAVGLVYPLGMILRHCVNCY